MSLEERVAELTSAVKTLTDVIMDSLKDVSEDQPDPKQAFPVNAPVGPVTATSEQPPGHVQNAFPFPMPDPAVPPPPNIPAPPTSPAVPIPPAVPAPPAEPAGTQTDEDIAKADVESGFPPPPEPDPKDKVISTRQATALNKKIQKIAGNLGTVEPIKQIITEHFGGKGLKEFTVKESDDLKKRLEKL